MYVTEIELVTKNRYKVQFENGPDLLLYNADIKRYKIKKNEEITDEGYFELVNETLKKRALSRAMHLLQSMDKTESQIVEKLKQGYYTEEIIEEVVEYLKDLNYINDLRYTQNYFQFKGNQKSKKQIEIDLMRRGISKEIIQSVRELNTEESGADESEIELIKKYVMKRRIDLNSASREELSKTYRFLRNKGFQNNEIQKVLFQKEFEI